MSNTTNTTTLPALIPMREQLPSLLEKNLPLLQKYKSRADQVLAELTEPTNDEEMEDFISSLAAVRDVYTRNSELRKQMTEITDAFKDIVMEYERDLDPKSDKSKYSQKKKLLEQYQQKKLEQRRKEEQEIAKRKEIENHKVDLRAKMLENLSQMVIASVKRVDAGSKDYFETATIEDFDKKAEVYKTNKPKLKQADYDACFQVTFNFELVKPDEFALYVNEVQKEETFEKWNAAFVEAISPIINEWRARIPDLKQQKLQLAEAKKKGDEDAQRLAEEQKKINDEQFQQRQQQLDQVAKEQQQHIQEGANLQKMSNEFAAQASAQQMDDVGGTRLVLKFTDPKLIPKALMNIIYHCMSHEKFPGIQRRDKSKKLMVDDKNRPVYVDEVQAWIDFFLKNCNASIEGTQIFEDSKTIIRK